MKYKYLIIAVIVISFAACKKNTGNNYPIAGKWQQTKLRILIQSSTGETMADTTYLQPFTHFDYAEFKNDGTCVIGTDHYYYPNNEGYPATPQAIPPNKAIWNYKADGLNYVLSPQNNLVNPGGFTSADTVSAINAHTLLLHAVFYSHSGSVTITDAYYTR